MLQVLIPTAGFAHVERVLARVGETGRVVAVVVYDAPEDGVPIYNKYTSAFIIFLSKFVFLLSYIMEGKREGGYAPHALIHAHGDLVPRAHVQVDEPGVVDVGRAFQRLGQAAGEAESAPGGRDGQDGDVAVPGGVVGGAAHRGGLFFELAHYFFLTPAGERQVSVVCFPPSFVAFSLLMN